MTSSSRERRAIRTITIPPSAGKGNLFCQIRELDRSFGAIYWRLLKHDGHVPIVAGAFAFGLLAAVVIIVFFETPLLILLAAPAMAVGVRALRYVLNDRRRARTKPTFTLYLRPFLTDRKPAFDLGAVVRYRDAPLTGGMGPDVQAIGSPHDSFPRNLGLNTALIQASDDTWQSVVVNLISRADRIWIHCSLDTWVQWEIRKVLELRKLTNVCFILPPKQKQEIWSSVLASAPERLSEIESLKERDMTRTMFVCFSADGSVVIVESQRGSADDYLPGIYAARYALLNPLPKLRRSSLKTSSRPARKQRSSGA